MHRSSGPRWGALEYVLVIILVLMVLFTLASLLWPAFKLFYQNSLGVTPTVIPTP